MNKIVIAPISSPDSMTQAIKCAIEGAKRLFVQTKKCHIASALPELFDRAESMDDIYDAVRDFDELNLNIARRLALYEDCVYMPLGRAISPTLKKALLDVGFNNIVSLPAPGFAELAMALPENSLLYSTSLIYSAHELAQRVDVSVPLAFEDVDNRLIAGELKLFLSRFLKDDETIVLAQMGEGCRFISRKMPLYELDRQQSYSYSTTILTPAVDLFNVSRNSLYDLAAIMTRLRADDGCPWDREQTHETLIPPLIEEAYEVMDTIKEGDYDAMLEELGDLLLQIYFHAEIERECSRFDIDDVATGIIQKLVYRHPHVFSNETAADSDEVLKNWELLKQAEKSQRTVADTLNAVPKSFPALMRAKKVQKRASRVGFDWSDPKEAAKKIAEETGELFEAIDSQSTSEHIQNEAGDLLFSVVNVLRLIDTEPEIALNCAVDRFVSRFCLMESMVADEKLCLENMSLDEMDVYWERAKKALEYKQK